MPEAKNYLSRFEEQKSSAKIEGLPSDIIVYVDQFHPKVTYDNRGVVAKAIKDEQGNEKFIYPETMEDIFGCMQPEIDVKLINEKGEEEKNLFTFGKMEDFDIDKGLIENNEFFRDLRDKTENYEDAKNQIKNNSTLRDILKYPEAKNELKTLLVSILEELNNSKNN